MTHRVLYSSLPNPYMVSICTRLVGNNAGPWTEIGSCKLKNPGGGGLLLLLKILKKNLHRFVSSYNVSCKLSRPPLSPPPAPLPTSSTN